MAKIEEITALLIDEIQSFEKAVATLQTESEKIKNTEFKVDTTPLNLKFSKLLNSIEVSFENQNTKLNTLQNKLSKTVIIPKDNARDLEEIPANVIADLSVHPVKWIDEVLTLALKNDPQGFSVEASK